MRKKDGTIYENYQNTAISGPALSGLTSAEAVLLAKQKKEERRHILDYSEHFKSEASARRYLQFKDFEEVGTVWRFKNHRATISKCWNTHENLNGAREHTVSNKPVYFVSYWLEAEEKKPTMADKGRPNCWHTEW